ncbi:hypothetical protein ACFOU2_13050 [Bacillus songklensis]|uniref:Uncharacterized protein n=1 Tax=Bacillus songklensis TaxID=1069116 RepID=A0ABV8B5A2_9BACI
MKKFMTKACIKVQSYLNNERGSQSLEWIGIAAIIVILTGVISTAMSGAGLGDTFVDKFSGFLEKIGGE